MDLFKKKKVEEPPRPIRQTEVKTETIGTPKEIKQYEEPTRIDEETAKVQFNILIRELSDIEKQLKSGKPMDIDETRKDKMPTEFRMLNTAERIKLELSNVIGAFKAAGYTDETIETMKIEALEGRKGYIYVTE